jgi:hypothetical protein
MSLLSFLWILFDISTLFASQIYFKHRERSSGTVLKVDLINSNVTEAVGLALRVCSGLFNRNENGEEYIFLVQNDEDGNWLSELNFPTSIYSSVDILDKCLRSGLVKGYIRYNFVAHQVFLPNIITIAGVLDAIPVEDGHPIPHDLPMLFDAVDVFNNLSQYGVTKLVFERWGNQTTAMAQMNPGFKASKWTPWRPKLSEKPILYLTDFVVKEKLFTHFLWWGCIKGTKEHELLEYITKNNFWPNPIPVYGYDESWEVLGGDIFEAGSNCVSSGNLGRIASQNFTNLSFFSRKSFKKMPLKSNYSPKLTFERNKTYLSIIIGDGDNLSFVKSTRKEWMEKRVKQCASSTLPRSCFPLLWSLSPKLFQVAPEILKWFHEKAMTTGKDFFVLPPSGDLYAYPTMMSDPAQDNFVRNTEESCNLFETNAIVSWEWTGYWNDAFEKYFPKYTKNKVVQAAFAVNVPYLLPILAFPRDKTFRIVNDSLVVFKPREWRGSKDAFPKFFFLSPEEMANEINSYTKGTVTHIYTTSDGGFDMDILYEMVNHLEDHVEIVDSKQLADLAFQSINS